MLIKYLLYFYLLSEQLRLCLFTNIFILFASIYIFTTCFFATKKQI